MNGERWAGGGVVLVLADECTASEVTFGPVADFVDARDDRANVRYDHIVDVAHLGPALEALGKDVIAVVIDPELAAPNEEAAFRIAAILARCEREIRVLMYAAVRPQAMHATLRLMSHLKCELVVRGFDTLPKWASGVTANVESTVRRREALRQLTILPVRCRIAWIDELAAPGETTVKRVLACARVERRSLERAHKGAGAWSPARLLRALRAEDA